MNLYEKVLHVEVFADSPEAAEAAIDRAYGWPYPHGVNYVDMSGPLTLKGTICQTCRHADHTGACLAYVPDADDPEVGVQCRCSNPARMPGWPAAAAAIARELDTEQQAQQ